MKNRRIIKWAIPIFLSLLFPFIFFMDVMYYHAHSDYYEFTLIGTPCAVCCLIGCILAIRRREKGLAVACVLAAASCLFFCYWIRRIPFCTMCDPIDRNDLGFMLKPFAENFYRP